MPETSSSSFIPRQGSVKKVRKTSRQVYIFTLVGYVLFFSALVSSAAVFLYQRHVDTKYQEKVVQLNSAIANFSDIKMEEVRSFNMRLLQSKERIENTVSAATLLESLEKATAQSVGFESFALKRIEDEKFELTAELNSPSFDSALFQRQLFEREPAIDSVEFEDVSLAENVEEGVQTVVTFRAILGVPLENISYEAVDQDNLSLPNVATTSGSTIGSSTPIFTEDNQQTL
jgi:hypothetical protein